jgi:VanZ family protein
MNVDRASLIRIPRSTYLAIALGYMGGIYILSSISIPFDDIKHPNPVAFCANLFHFPLYMGLAATLLMGLRAIDSEDGRILKSGSIIAALVILALYGAFDEYHQSWSGRTPSVLDFLVNICGGICAVWALKYYVERSLSIQRLVLFSTGIIAVACVLAFYGMY